MPNPILLNKPNFTTNLPFNTLMIEAYQRCRISLPEISGQMIDDALRSANFILISYNNRGSNLYSIQTEVIPLQAGLPSYQVPDFYEINDVTMANFVRQLGNTTTNIGTPATNAGGNAALAFDGDPATACVNTSTNGQITYTFANVAQMVQFVGFQTAADDNQTYNLQFFYQTNAANPATKQIVYETGPITPFPNQPYYFYLNPGQQALTWGVQEIGGATLNMAEIFFDIYNTRRIVTALSRQDWMTLASPNLNASPIPATLNPLVPWPPQPPANSIGPSPVIPSTSSGFPSGYYTDRQPNPVINFYPLPDLSFPYCVFTYTSYFQELKYLQQVLSIPGSFIPAITAELAYALSVKYPEKLTAQQAMDLKAQRDQEFIWATDEDRQKVKFKIVFDYQSFGC